MSEQSDTYTELWNPQALEIRPCSRLFSLKPIGMGTSATESLSSYLCRLANEHCVSLQKLVTQEISSLIIDPQNDRDSSSRSISSIFGNSDAKPAINGMREKTRSLTLALEKLTLRQDLKYLSCLTYKEVIRERGLFRQHKAWCPKCFEEWQQEHKTLYEPLLWSFKDVGYCLKHNCRLVNSCPHCGKEQKAIGNNSRIGYCESCKKPLITHVSNAETEMDEKERQIIEGIGELIKVTPLLYKPPTLSESIEKLQLIQFYFERSLRQDLTQFIALGKILEQLKIATKYSDRKLNFISLLIPVCNSAKLSITQFMRQDTVALGRELGINVKST